MLKMLLDAGGGKCCVRGAEREEGRAGGERGHAFPHPHTTLPTGIVLTNDGNAILREIDVTHPAAKVREERRREREMDRCSFTPSRSPHHTTTHPQSVIELSRTQDEEVGDGTTSVIILAGELLSAAEPLLDRRVHPTVLIRGYAAAQAAALEAVRALAFDVDVTDRDAMLRVLRACMGTKYSSRVGADIPTLALDAVSIVAVPSPPGSDAPPDVDVKRYAKVEKIPGGDVSDSRVLKGVMFNKDVVAPGRMARTLRNPRILLLDCALEYKKSESQTSVELTNEEDWSALLAQEEAAVKAQCDTIAALKPDLVITEKGLSDLAVHHLTKAGITAIRRVRKTDNNRIARAVGATIVNRVEEATEADVGTGAGLFEVVKLGDEFYTFIVDCAAPKACTVLLRGASKDVLNEVERNLADALGVARNLYRCPRLVPGGGAAEMAAAGACARARPRSPPALKPARWPPPAAPWRSSPALWPPTVAPTSSAP